MQSHFYAYMARMKLIKRWGLRRSTIQENDQEHSHLVSMIAHALALIKNTRYGGNVDPGRVTLLAVYHEAPEVITGDMATPIKYFNRRTRKSSASPPRSCSAICPRISGRNTDGCCFRTRKARTGSWSRRPTGSVRM